MKDIFAYKLLLSLTLLGNILIRFSYAADNAMTPQLAFKKGLALYTDKQYEKAIPILQQVVITEPDNAEYHNILAKNYGREAERSNWFKAINYAKKTLLHLEIAVQLEPNNLQYLDDLMDYYLKAPGFLGGDTKKAKEIGSKIKVLQKLQNDKF